MTGSAAGLSALVLDSAGDLGHELPRHVWCGCRTVLSGEQDLPDRAAILLFVDPFGAVRARLPSAIP